MRAKLFLMVAGLAVLTVSFFLYACGRQDGDAIGDRVVIGGGVEG